MNSSNMTIMATAASLLLTTGAKADDRADARELLLMWDPSEVTISDGVLTAVLPQRTVTQQIYVASIQSGLCFGLYTDKPLDSVSEIVILNRTRGQGYVHEAGLEVCPDYEKDAAKARMLGRTHAY